MRKDIGKFIQETRKNKNLTQRELAEQVGISDKTVSKWENGNGMPDTSMLMPLCDALDITVNELLSCERIPSENYTLKAEENIMTLMKENENAKKDNKKTTIIGIIIIVMGLIFMGISSAGLNFPIAYYIDLPSFIIVALLTVGTVFASGARTKKKGLEVIGKTVLPIGLMIAIAESIIVMGNIENIELIGPNLAVVFLSVLYSVIIKIVVEILKARFKDESI